jgi:hypothetical protein
MSIIPNMTSPILLEVVAIETLKNSQYHFSCQEYKKRDKKNIDNKWHVICELEICPA